jgi:exosome complex RNA-binding protein Rrp42 (RNase PH superfamily)
VESKECLVVDPTWKIAKLNDSRYEVSLESDHGVVKCYVRAKLPGPELLGHDAERESERKQLALKKATALAKALNAAIVKT